MNAIRPWIPALLVLAGAATAQTPVTRGTIELARVREIVGFLASDAMAGRDSPSAELDRAAEWIARRFAAAGLQPGAQGGWFHRFRLPGLRLATDRLRVVVHGSMGDVELRPGEDVRVLRGTGPFTVERGEVLRVTPETANGLWRRVRGRKTLVMEVDADAPLWRARPPGRSMLRSRREGRRPWLLVRRGVLPLEPWRLTVRLPAPEKCDVELRNVVGLLPASDEGREPREVVMFSAHYDHVGVGVPVGGDAIYNGADDDATGTTAVIALAEAFAARSPRRRRDLAFVCFAAEEKGLRGSRAFAEAPPFPLERIAVDVNVEMIGRPPAKARFAAWITGSELSDFAEMAAPALERAGVRLVDFPAASRLFRASDNYSLARRGVVAHSISAGSLHEDYHRPSDEVGKLDLDHMTAVIRGLYELGVDLARADRPPRYNDRGRELLRPR